jgi:UDP:flavonoid glycosyltransferase YjiC (YdhE family)
VRVLFSSVWGIGHVFPMVPLAQALQAAGHDVLWAAPEPARRHAEAAGLPTAQAGLAPPGIKQLWDQLSRETAQLPPQEHAAVAFPRMFGAAAPAMAADLLAVAQRWQPDLLVHDNAELAAPLVAAVCGRPCLTHAFGGAIPAAIVEGAARVLAPLWKSHGLEVPPSGGLFADGYLDICPSSVQGVPLDHVGRRFPLRPVPYTGPSGPLPDVVLHPDDRPLVYLTLGTVAENPAGLATAAAAIAALPVRLVVAVGPKSDPSALGPQPANVSVAAWVPQAELLPRCDVVVSHGGSGTFLGALAHGVPQLCLPQLADQFRNAAAGSGRGVCLALQPGEADEARVRGAVEHLLRDEGTRRAASAVQEEIREMPSPARVGAELEGLVARLP